MTDVFDIAKRSQVMSRIRGKGNKSTELTLAAAFRQQGVVGWRRHVLLKPRVVAEDLPLNRLAQRISVRPDFIFRAQRLAIFVDGCFWHGCPEHSKRPATNVEFWEKKLAGNSQRDQRATRALQAAGWIVVRIWEHELRDVDIVVHKLRQYL